MYRILLALSLFVSTSAWACPDDPNCTKENCKMQDHTASAAPLPDGSRAALEVSGMECAHCADSVKATLMGVKGVKGANVDVATGKAEIAYDDKATNIDALVKAVNNTGHFQAKAAAPAPASPPPASPPPAPGAAK